MALPDFLIIGAMKCGTSTLQAQLAAQPGIFMTTPKEPNFFSDDAIYANGLGWYEDLFAGAGPDDRKGEIDGTLRHSCVHTRVTSPVGLLGARPRTPDSRLMGRFFS